VVLAPDFDELKAFHLSEADVAAVVRAVTRLAELAPPPLGILGVSFGAGPALLAAADPAIRERVDLVGSLGGYFDLAHVVGFITTGWFEDNGIFARARQQEYNRWKLLAALTPYVTDQAERGRLQRIVDLKLADPRRAVESEVNGLGPEGRRLFTLVENRERDRVARLLAELSPPARKALERLSPAASMGRVQARLLIAHGRDDDSIPFTESLKLARSAPNAGRAVIFDGFRHAFPSEHEWLARFSRLKDLELLVWLLDDLLGMRPRSSLDPPPPPGAPRSQQLYIRFCASCHGLHGGGSWRSTLLLIRPGNLADRSRMQALTDQYLFDLVKQGGAPVGKPGMPAFGFHLTDAEIGELVAYVRSLSASAD
jgi:mono/diheme cytochrome c family protein/pimeloyl-ACP methyl ester carboxylesterase